MKSQLTRKQLLLLLALLLIVLLATCDFLPAGRMPMQEKELETMKRKLEQQMLNKETGR